MSPVYEPILESTTQGGRWIVTDRMDAPPGGIQLHDAWADGSVVFRNKLSRAKLLDFVAAQPRCTVAMEACGGAHHWGREIGRLGHAVRLVPPIYPRACCPGTARQPEIGKLAPDHLITPGQ